MTVRDWDHFKCGVPEGPVPEQQEGASSVKIWENFLAEGTLILSVKQQQQQARCTVADVVGLRPLGKMV